MWRRPIIVAVVVGVHTRAGGWWWASQHVPAGGDDHHGEGHACLGKRQPALDLLLTGRRLLGRRPRDLSLLPHPAQASPVLMSVLWLECYA